MGRKTSIVWNHFTIPVLYPKKALCNYCHQLVCRGQANLGTTSLMNHLKRCNEFKVLVFGMPKGGNDMSGCDTQIFRKGPDEEYIDGMEPPTSAGADSFGGERSAMEPAWGSSISGAPKLLPIIPTDDNAPSFVHRNIGRDNRAEACQFRRGLSDYKCDDRSSVLLYGDISSTSDTNEEPSSSTAGETASGYPLSHFSDLKNYSLSTPKVDFVHGGLMLHLLYQQYLAGRYCDMCIVPQKKSSNEIVISETGKVTKRCGASKEDFVVNVHSCVLGAMSRKVNSFVEMGCGTVHLKKGGAESVEGLMEIVYTGKLSKIRTYSESQLLEILEVARFLEVDLAVQYLMSEIPEGKPVRSKSNVDKLFEDRLQSLSATNGNFAQRPTHAQTRNSTDSTSKETECNSRLLGPLLKKRRLSDNVQSDSNSSSHESTRSDVLGRVKREDTGSQDSYERARKHAVHEMVDSRDETPARQAVNADRAPLPTHGYKNSENSKYLSDFEQDEECANFTDSSVSGSNVGKFCASPTLNGRDDPVSLLTSNFTEKRLS